MVRRVFVRPPGEDLDGHGRLCAHVATNVEIGVLCRPRPPGSLSIDHVSSSVSQVSPQRTAEAPCTGGRPREDGTSLSARLSGRVLSPFSQVCRLLYCTTFWQSAESLLADSSRPSPPFCLGSSRPGSPGVFPLFHIDRLWAQGDSTAIEKPHRYIRARSTVRNDRDRRQAGGC